MIAMDLFRFDDGKIVEHCGGQEPEALVHQVSGEALGAVPHPTRLAKTRPNTTATSMYNADQAAASR